MAFFKNLFKKNKKYMLKEGFNNLVCYKTFNGRILKLNNSVVVPENFECYVFAKEQLLDCFNAGEHKMFALTMPKASRAFNLEKPVKDKGYKKQIKADLLFVNLNDFRIKNFIKVKKGKIKYYFNYDLDFKVVNAKLFLKFLLSEVAYFKDDYAERQTAYYLEYLSYYYILDFGFNEDKLQNYLSGKFKKIGVEIINLTLSDNESLNQKASVRLTIKENVNTKEYLYNDEFKNAGEEGNTFDGLKENYNVFNESEETNFNNLGGKSYSSLIDLSSDTQNSRKIEYFKCDNCGTYLPSTAKTCFNCNKSFEEDKTLRCENCGKVLEKKTHVCPHCKCILI